MFERYTERARRTLFFARYESSALGSLAIETEHLLLGLLRESTGLTNRIFALANIDLEAFRAEAQSQTSFKEKVSTTVEIPFSGDTKRALMQAAIEADRLEHGYIGVEHLLLALVHDSESSAGKLLAARGLTYDGVRKEVVRLLNEGAGELRPAETTRAELLAAIEHIKRDVSQLASLIDHGASARPVDVVEPFELAQRIHEALDRLKPLANH